MVFSMLLRPIWVEIPVVDLDRAMKFYGTILNKQLESVDEGVRRYANLVRTDDGRSGASINQTSNFPPSATGVLVYFQAEGTMADILQKIMTAGGEIVIPQSNIVETDASMGYYATFKDTEGNVIGIFSAM
jgi:predicted enzyme related to lactoylglutathione lyase